MSVANRYKVLTLSGSQCFALLRAMNTRETWLKGQIELAERNDESAEIQLYMHQQLVDILAVRDTFNSTPFQEGRPS
jgi:hypothetical protein